MAKTDTASQAVEAIQDADVERALRGEQVALEIADPGQVSLQIMDRILHADNVDAILGGNKAISGKDILGRPFSLTGVRWHRSAFEGEGDTPGFSVFAVLDAVLLDDGERVAVTTGAGNVMAQVFQLSRLGALPQDVILVESDKASASGFRPQWLESAAVKAA